MKKYSYLFCTILLLTVVTLSSQNTGIDWQLKPDELLSDETNKIIGKRYFERESSFTFDTVQYTTITVEKVFWDTPFQKEYWFESDTLINITLSLILDDSNYYDFSEQKKVITRLKLWDYKVNYRKMITLLLEKYGDPTSYENIELLKDMQMNEAFLNNDKIDVYSEWILENETINFSLNHYYAEYGLPEMTLWYISYEQNKDKKRQQQKEAEEQKIKEEKRRIEEKRKKEASKKIINEI